MYFHDLSSFSRLEDSKVRSWFCLPKDKEDVKSHVEAHPGDKEKFQRNRQFFILYAQKRDHAFPSLSPSPSVMSDQNLSFEAENGVVGAGNSLV